ncbi:MAG: hypothetical protein ACR2MY_12275, partial [Candidatus Dormibacteria bacterium]
ASLLRTLEGLFGISEHLNDAGTAKPMTDLFAVSTVSTSPTPSTSNGNGGAGAGQADGGGLPGTSTTVPAAGIVALMAALLIGTAAASALRNRLSKTRPPG